MRAQYDMRRAERKLRVKQYRGSNPRKTFYIEKEKKKEKESKRARKERVINITSSFTFLFYYFGRNFEVFWH